MEKIDGGVTAAKGFLASGIHCGIRKNKSKKDLALIVSDRLCTASAVYTTNLVKGAPLLVTQKNLADGYAQAIICNSGNANTCNANGKEIAENMCELIAEFTKIPKENVIVASTGVIGQKMDIAPIKNNIGALIGSLGKFSSDANQAIMTTDTIEKSSAYSFSAGGKKCVIGGIAKGSGMIHPNMATMLVFLTTDVNISKAMLDKAIKDDVKTSFNMISVDGDTSTNDMMCILANGEANNKTITKAGEDYDNFTEALNKVTTDLCRLIASDGEGASKLLECNVVNAKDTLSAQKVAKSVVCSNLLKCAMFGSDANWGRVLCAIGYSGAEINVEKTDVAFKSKAGCVTVCKGGYGIAYSEEAAKKILLEKEIDIQINLNDGAFSATAWGCDLTYDYVKINGDYRT